MARRCELDPAGDWYGLTSPPLLGDLLEESSGAIALGLWGGEPPISGADSLCPYSEMKPSFKTKSRAWTVERFCLTCGSSSSEWLNGGVVISGKTYCCQGCANGAGCVCRSQEDSPKSKEIALRAKGKMSR